MNTFRYFPESVFTIPESVFMMGRNMHLMPGQKTLDVLLETGINISPLPVWLDEWEHPETYGQANRTVEIATGTGLWYHPGKPGVTLRWVFDYWGSPAEFHGA